MIRGETLQQFEMIFLRTVRRIICLAGDAADASRLRAMVPASQHHRYLDFFGRIRRARFDRSRNQVLVASPQRNSFFKGHDGYSFSQRVDENNQ
jgi:hypothetical protein